MAFLAHFDQDLCSLSKKTGARDCGAIADGGVLIEALDTHCAGFNNCFADSIKNACAVSIKNTFSELPKVGMAAKLFHKKSRSAIWNRHQSLSASRREPHSPYKEQPVGHGYHP